jgi:SPW repeat-containing protein
MLPSNGIALATLIMYGQSEKGLLKTGSGNFSKEVIGLKRLILTNLALGVWLMVSPFVLQLFYRGVFKVTWVDVVFGFSIAAISLGRLFSYSSEDIIMTDWIVTIFGILTLINPLLYNYYGITLATLNNLLIGGAVCLFASYLDWNDSHRLT